MVLNWLMIFFSFAGERVGLVESWLKNLWGAELLGDIVNIKRVREVSDPFCSLPPMRSSLQRQEGAEMITYLQDRPGLCWGLGWTCMNATQVVACVVSTSLTWTCPDVPYSHCPGQVSFPSSSRSDEGSVPNQSGWNGEQTHHQVDASECENESLKWYFELTWLHVLSSLPLMLPALKGFCEYYLFLSGAYQRDVFLFLTFFF